MLNTNTPSRPWSQGVALHALPIVRAHNLVLLAGLAGNGFAAYLLAWTFTRRAMPAIIAGTSFATCAYVSVHLLGHVNLMHAWVLPLACLAWVALLDSPGIVRALGVAVAFAAAVYSDYYYAIYTGLFMVAWAAVTLRDPAVTWSHGRFRVLAALVAGLGVLATVVAIVIGVSSGIVVTAGPIHISALHARNPMSIAGVCALAWVLLHLRIRAPRSPAPPRARLAISIAAAGAICLVLVSPVLVASVRLIGSGDYSSQQYFWRSAPRGVDLATLVAGPPMHGVTGTYTDRCASIDEDRPDRADGVAGDCRVRADRRGDALAAPARAGRPPLGLDCARALRVVARTVPRRRRAGHGRAAAAVAGPVRTDRVERTHPGARVRDGAARLERARRAGALRVVMVSCAVRPAGRLRRAGERARPLPHLCPATARSRRRRPRGRRNAVVIEIPTACATASESGDGSIIGRCPQTTHGQRLVGGFVARLPPSVTSSYRKTEAVARLFDWSEGAQDAAALPLDLRDGLRRSGVQYLVVEQDAFSSLRPTLEQRGLRMVVSDHGRELYSVE